MPATTAPSASSTPTGRRARRSDSKQRGWIAALFGVVSALAILPLTGRLAGGGGAVSPPARQVAGIGGRGIRLPNGLTQLRLEGYRGSLTSLPPGLRRLEVHWSEVLRLGPLPPRLQSLILVGSRVDRLYGGLPGTLLELGLDADSPRLDRYPRHLLALELRHRPVRSGWGLPASLRRLHLEGTEVTGVEGLPADLRRLSLVATAVGSLAGLPDSLEVLRLERNTKLSLIELPPYLHELQLSRQGRMQSTSPPRFLRRLDFRLSSLAPLPEPLWGISELRLDGLPFGPPWSSLELRRLELIATEVTADLELPATLEALALRRMRGPVGPLVAGTLPGDLIELDLAGTRLGGRRPSVAKLERVDLSGTGVEDLGWLPDSLATLVYRSAPFASLPPLPAALTHLDVADSAELTTLEGLPSGLRSLDVSRAGIRHLPRLPGSLHSLTLDDVQLAESERLPTTLRRLTVVAREPGS